MKEPKRHKIGNYAISVSNERIIRSVCYPYRYYLYTLVFLFFIQVPNSVFAQVQDTTMSANNLKKLSLEELMNIEVSSVSKHMEKLKDAASAVQVITQEDIRRSGAKTLPEALKLAANLQVAQVNSSQWAISARGFDNVLADKLLVLIDGRAVYTPLYAGVFWDVQNVLLEDVDRIEVISGPGGTLWGANAVNGVINIITKKAKDTKGLYVEAISGTNVPIEGSIRYGGNIGDKISYRVYGTGYKLGNTLLKNDSTAKDQWNMVQGGFRMDWQAKENSQLSLQSNIYRGKPNPDGATAVTANGENIVAQWVHRALSEKWDFKLQAYYDHTWRDFNNGFAENLRIYDIDWQYRYKISQRQVLSWGGDYRMMDDKEQNLPLFEFLPAHKILTLYSVYAQDEIVLIRDRLHFTAGIKLEHNSYTGFEYQPNGRLAWTPTNRQTIWAAVSRAVRTPARIDRDFDIYLTPTLKYIAGGNLVSEDLLAYEAGWRIQAFKRLTASVSGFYNVYNNIRSVEPGPPPLGFPVTFGNDVQGETYGLELAGTQQINSWWRIRGGYTYLRKNLRVKPGTIDLNNASAESDDPENQVLIQSMMDLPGRTSLGIVGRYVDLLPKPYVHSYTGLDAQLGWKINKAFDINIVGQNLLYNHHAEFIPSSPSPRLIQRSLYGKIICRF